MLEGRQVRFHLLKHTKEINKNHGLFQTQSSLVKTKQHTNRQITHLVWKCNAQKILLLKIENFQHLIKGNSIRLNNLMVQIQ